MSDSVREMNIRRLVSSPSSSVMASISRTTRRRNMASRLAIQSRYRSQCVSPKFSWKPHATRRSSLAQVSPRDAVRRQSERLAWHDGRDRPGPTDVGEIGLPLLCTPATCWWYMNAVCGHAGCTGYRESITVNAAGLQPKYRLRAGARLWPTTIGHDSAHALPAVVFFLC